MLQILYINNILKEVVMVYFIQQGKGGPIKIGSAANPLQRMKTLQTGSPDKLYLLKSFKAGPDLESHLHKIFKKYKLNGEWYKPSTPILAYIFGNQIENEVDDLKKAVKAFEKQVLIKALEAKKYDKVLTAKSLNISERQLRYKIQVHNLKKTISMKQDPINLHASKIIPCGLIPYDNA
jgi:hypothetical protein